LGDFAPFEAGSAGWLLAVCCLVVVGCLVVFCWLFAACFLSRGTAEDTPNTSPKRAEAHTDRFL
jgi:hypothetical protein